MATKPIALVPLWNHWRGNRVFDPTDDHAYQPCYALAREALSARGFTLNTIDITPPEQADILWFVDLPAAKRDFDLLCAATRPGTKLVLQVFESPLFTRRSLEHANHALFDCVFTYGSRQSGPSTQTLVHELPTKLRPGLRPTRALPFADRRCVVMINSNKIAGWLAPRTPGFRGLPGIGEYLAGWRLPWSRALRPAHGELYSWRRRFAKVAAKRQPGAMDIYGQGWRGECHSWFPGYSRASYRCALQAPTTLRPGSSMEAKIACLAHYRFGIATENFRGREGYVSEKIFDTLAAGVVPVYLGEESIADIVPPAPSLTSANSPAQQPCWTTWSGARKPNGQPCNGPAKRI